MTSEILTKRLKLTVFYWGQRGSGIFPSLEQEQGVRTSLARLMRRCARVNSNSPVESPPLRLSEAPLTSKLGGRRLGCHEALNSCGDVCSFKRNIPPFTSK
ncbi:hypothetical protein ILYODFUR_027475 [Ilyodon furcidens]|uniref:Uncharacterized protein n=1 Tax=Ilyodon furcidens TaxID=33524 RepID=A0ABV0UWR7_9TELE